MADATGSAASVSGAVGAAVSLLGRPLGNVLDSISKHHHEDDTLIAYWNKWEDRDQRARIEKTYGHGRFSHEKKTMGIPNGRWYCCLKQEAAKKKGIPLDR